MVNKKQIGIGSALAAAAAAAGYYYFYASKDAEQNRKKVVRWASDMKSDVVLEAKKMKRLDRAQMLKIVDKVAAAYRSAREIEPKELAKAARELKANWARLAGEASPSKAPARRTPTKRAKKTAKRAK
jgi:hypothetical protein